MTKLKRAASWLLKKVRTIGPSEPYRGMDGQAAQHVQRNFWIILIAQFFNKLATTLASAKIVLPWIMNSMGAPTFLTGLLVPIRESGSLLPQVLIGGKVKQLGVRKPLFVVGVLLQAGCVGLIAVASLNLDGLVGGVAVVSLLVIFSLGRGVCSLTSKDVLGKTVPEANRGRLLGLSGSLAGLIGIATGLALVMNVFGSGSQAVLLLVLACIGWALTALIFSTVREFSGATEPSTGVWKQLKESAQLLVTDKPFRRFVLVRTLLMSSSLSAPYFILLAQQQSGSDSIRSLGLFMLVSGVASFLSGAIWGRLADRSSRRVLLITGGLTACLCSLSAVSSQFTTSYSMTISVALFFLLMVTHQGVRLGRKTYIVDLAEGNERTQYVATSNSIIGVLLLFTGVVGAIAAQISLELVLLGFSAMALASMVLAHQLPEAEEQSR